MTDQQFTILAGVLLESRDLLIEIRDLLTQPVEIQTVDEGCQHPDDKRVSLATPSQPDHWVCHECRYEHTGVITN